MAKTKAKRKATAKTVRARKPVRAKATKARARKPVKAEKVAKRIVRVRNVRATKATAFQPLTALQDSFNSVINYFK